MLRYVLNPFFFFFFLLLTLLSRRGRVLAAYRCGGQNGEEQCRTEIVYVFVFLILDKSCV
jgi:hypothetical protein